MIVLVICPLCIVDVIVGFGSNRLLVEITAICAGINHYAGLGIGRLQFNIAVIVNMLLLIAVVVTAGGSIPMVGFVVCPLVLIGVNVLKFFGILKLCVTANDAVICSNTLFCLGGLFGYHAIAINVISLFGCLATTGACAGFPVRSVVSFPSIGEFVLCM